MTFALWTAIVGWLAIAMMAAAYIVGSTGRVRVASGAAFALGGLLAFSMVVLRFAEAF